MEIPYTIIDMQFCLNKVKIVIFICFGAKMVDTLAKMVLFGSEWHVLGFFRLIWRLVSFVIYVSFRHYFSWKIWPFKPEIAPKLHFFQPKGPFLGMQWLFLRLFRHEVTFFTTHMSEVSSDIFKKKMQMRPLKFIYISKTTILQTPYYCKFRSINNGTVFLHRKLHLLENIVFFPWTSGMWNPRKNTKVLFFWEQTGMKTVPF